MKGTYKCAPKEGSTTNNKRGCCTPVGWIVCRHESRVIPYSWHYVLRQPHGGELTDVNTCVLGSGIEPNLFMFTAVRNKAWHDDTCLDLILKLEISCQHRRAPNRTSLVSIHSGRWCKGCSLYAPRENKQRSAPVGLDQ